jgi:hypothetical protein
MLEQQKKQLLVLHSYVYKKGIATDYHAGKILAR